MIRCCISLGVNYKKKKNPANWNASTSEEHLCGGSIITRDRILTAAHCVEGFNKLNEEFQQLKNASSKLNEELKQLFKNASRKLDEEKLKKASSREINYWIFFWNF